MYKHSVSFFFCQDLLPAVGNPPPWKHPLQEEDLQGRLHRHLQPRSPAHRLRAAGGEQLLTNTVNKVQINTFYATGKQVFMRYKSVLMIIQFYSKKKRPTCQV